MKTIRIGTRKSKLAVRQTELTAELLKRRFPELSVELVYLTTRGDQNQTQALSSLGSKGLFVAEFEQALLDGSLDLAVHSGKDLPSRLAAGLEIACTPERADPRDVLVTPAGKILGREEAAVIGTGSARRQTQLRELYPHAETALIRGNLDTRLNKLLRGEYDAIVVAAAGLDRLHITEQDGFEFLRLEPEQMIPAACQGIIAVEGKAGSEASRMAAAVSDARTMLCFETERKLLTVLGSDCAEPSAGYAALDGDTITLRAMYGDRKTVLTGAAENRLELAKRAGERLRG